MKKAYFITGTDTGVGKTFVTALIASALKSMGLNAGVMKPVETGCKRKNNRLVPEDALLLKQAACSPLPLNLI
ncbi:MAG: dethiobiotin synthase, partial [Deltaproteobacteria bacterium]|nr:dethiobiotin synthase [Deltaproteobacteria bacterium]